MTRFQLQLEDSHAPDYAAEVVTILNRVFDADDPSTPTLAAEALSSLFNRIYDATGVAGGFLWSFWDLMHSLARQVFYDSSEQDQIAEVVNAMHHLPSKVVDLGDEWGEARQIEVWTKLPMFTNTLYETLQARDLGAADNAQRKSRNVNIQAYAARIAGLGFIQFEVYAIWALVDALEGVMTLVRGAPDELNADPVAVEDIDFKVQSAAMWIIYAGRQLYGRDEEILGATAGPLWKLDKKQGIKLRRKLKGTNGLCPQRWQLWKERFLIIRDTQGLDEKSRKLAGDSYVIMTARERG